MFYVFGIFVLCPRRISLNGPGFDAFGLLGDRVFGPWMDGWDF